VIFYKEKSVIKTLMVLKSVTDTLVFLLLPAISLFILSRHGASTRHGMPEAFRALPCC